MSSPSEEVYVVEQLVKDEHGCWWKPTFTHTNLAVAFGKLESLGPCYQDRREGTRVRVYKGTSTTISRNAVSEVNYRLLSESRVVGNAKEGASAKDMVDWMKKTYVCLDVVEDLEKVKGNKIYDYANQLNARYPLDILDWEFEWVDMDEKMKAESELLEIGEKWVSRKKYQDPKVKKPAPPLTAVEGKA